MVGNSSLDLPQQVEKEKEVEDEVSHDIRDHMGKLHKQRKSEDPKTLRADRIKTLRRLLRKL